MTIPSYDIIIDIEAIVMQTGEQLHGANQPGFTPLSDMTLLIENARPVIGHNIVVFAYPPWNGCWASSCRPTW